MYNVNFYGLKLQKGAVFVKIKDSITYVDLAKLKKETLKEISADMDLPDIGSADELASGINASIFEDPKKRDILGKYDNIILAPRGSVSWFVVHGDKNIKGLKDRLTKLNPNPFKKMIEYSNMQLSTTPTIFAGIEITEGTYMLRYAFRSGNISLRSMSGKETVPSSSFGTVYVDESNGIIEVRAPYNSSGKIANQVVSMLNTDEDKIKLVKKDILEKYNDMGEFANKLNGKIKETTDIPNAMFKDLSTEQLESILNILNSIDNEINEVQPSEDEEQSLSLFEQIEKSKVWMSKEFPEVSFLWLVLSGLGKVQLGSTIEDLRKSPLYGCLSPYLENQGGYIEFPFLDGSIEKIGEIQVGIASKTINFSKNVTESALTTVRNQIFEL